MTWSAGSTVGIVGADGAEILRKDVGEMVGRFVQEYGGRTAEATNRRSDGQDGRTVGLLW